MANVLKVGDVVQLKSGGPKMVVTYLQPFKAGGYNNGDPLCKWFDNDNQVKKEMFAADSLKLVPED